MGKHLGVAYNLRLPPELKDKIAESAKELNRSMNADIVARLEKSFELNHLHIGMGLPSYAKPTVGGMGLSSLNLQSIENLANSKTFLQDPNLENISTEDLMKELAKRLDGFSVVANK